MSEYIYILFGVAIVSGTVCALAPSDSAEKGLKMLCSLCVICVMVSPLSRGILALGSKGFDLELNFQNNEENYNDIYQSYLKSENKAIAQKNLSAELCQAFDVSDGALGVTLEYGESGVSECVVYISTNAIKINPREIEKYIYERISVKCTFIYTSNENL